MSDEFNFDDYDDAMDFGFNTVDEAEVTEYETEIKSRVADQGGAIPSGLENKIDKLIELRQGDETQIDILKKEHKEDMLKVEKMIMPLLYNLMKNPEDVYIKWPNRKEIIQKQISKIVSITRK
jgi:phosphoribosylformylglycinamidine (FGAM) synthase PurS component